MESVISNFEMAIDVLLAGKVLSKILVIIAMFSSVVLFVQDQTYVNNKLQDEYQYSRYTEHDLYAEDVIQLALNLKGTQYKLQVNGSVVDLTQSRGDIEDYLVDGVLSHDKRYECSQVRDAGTGTYKAKTFTFYVTEVSNIEVGGGGS